MAFPDYGVTDDFNRTDSDPISGSWDGPLRAGENKLEIISNQVAHSTGAGTAGTMYYTVPIVRPFQAWIEIPNASGDQGIDYCIQEPKLTSELEGYRWQSNGAFGLELYRIAQGSFTKIDASIPGTIADGDALGVHLDYDGAHKLYWRDAGVWALMATYTDTRFISGYVGIVQTNVAAGRLDNFSAVQIPHGYPTFPSPSLSVLDDFNRANESPLSGGGNWSTPTTSGDPNLDLSSNKVIHATAAGSTTAAWWTPEQFTRPLDVFCTVGSDQSNIGVDYCVQQPGTATPDGYRYGTHPSFASEQGRAIKLHRFDNDVFTELLVANGWGVEAKTGDQLGVRLLADGTHLLFYKPVGGEWQMVDSVSDTAYTSGYCGVMVGLQAAGMSVDDFGAGAFVTGVTTEYKRFTGPAQLTGSAATLYTCPTGKRARILHIHASNPSASEVDLNLSIGTDAAATRVYDDLPLAADQIEHNYDPYDLAAGEIIQGWASTAGTVVLTITGYEQTA